MPQTRYPFPYKNLTNQKKNPHNLKSSNLIDECLTTKYFVHIKKDKQKGINKS